MTDQAQSATTTTGAISSGAKATAEHGKSMIEWPPEPIPHEEAVEALEEESQKQTDFNNDVNKLHTETTKKMIEKFPIPPEHGDFEAADKARKEAMQQYKAELAAKVNPPKPPAPAPEPAKK